MELNPSKCIFGVPSGILLGYIVSARGIKPNPDKVSAITNMKRPTYVKDIQKLIGCMAALNRFISRLHHYFDYYKIAMVTEFPLGDILYNKRDQWPHL